VAYVVLVGELTGEGMTLTVEITTVTALLELLGEAAEVVTKELAAEEGP